MRRIGNGTKRRVQNLKHMNNIMFLLVDTEAFCEWAEYLHYLCKKLNSCDFEYLAQDDEIYKGVTDKFYEVYFRYHTSGISRPSKRTLMFAYSADAHLNLDQIEVIY